MLLRVASFVFIACLVSLTSVAQGVRDHTRPAPGAGTAVSDSQASDLTLTLSTASTRLVQIWIRTAGTIDTTGKVLTASLSASESALVKVGQRVRAFPPSSKASMYQAFVTGVAATAGGAVVKATLSAAGRQGASHYVMEIVVERGPFLAIPNEAIIEEGDRRVVYVQRTAGHYVPQDIQTGIHGELLTEVLEGLAEGDQVVTFGSFFIDAEHKLKGDTEAHAR